MDVAASCRPRPRASELLLEHCAALDPGRPRPCARLRLEALLGPDLTRRLVSALVSRGR